ncbi:MAG: BamA/TamA family outer membrane protein [Phocaeicola sp.]
MIRCLLFNVFLFFLLLCTSCSVSKFIPADSYLLDKVRIESDTKSVKSADYGSYIRQNANSKWFNLVKIPMHIYGLSGTDSTNVLNRFLWKLGDEPVLYNRELAEKTRKEIEKAVHNTGYIRASVSLDENVKGKKLKVSYKIKAGKPYSIGTLLYQVEDEQLRSYLLEDSAKSLISKGMPFDVNVLNGERQRITKLLQNKGYYKFNKDYITFQADTIRNSYNVDLTLRVLPFRSEGDSLSLGLHPQYWIGDINFVVGKDINRIGDELLSNYDSLSVNGETVYYEESRYLRPKTLFYFNRIKKDELYSERDVQNSYVSLGRLGALKYANISFKERFADDKNWLDTYISTAKGRNQSMGFELEGTNSAGDLGAAASLSYQHRNIFRGSETFGLRLRGAYEAVSGIEGDYISNNYLEYGIEATLGFPEFKFPFLSSRFKKRVRATSEVSLKYNAQMRPDFLRTSASASWRYRWVNRRSQHRFNLLDINYLYIPSNSLSSSFEQYLLDLLLKGSLIYYSYLDQFIVSMGYSYAYNSTGNSLIQTPTRSSHSVRINIEEAGNLLYGVSKLSPSFPQNSDGKYVLANIPFAQYIKADFEYTRNFIIDPKNSLAFHVGVGIAFPYGNSQYLPFEKRYFSGGANSVRGWSIRTLGPGSSSISEGTDFNSFFCNGDMKIDLNLEYRTHLFWKLNGAFYLDAGNVWNLQRDSYSSEGSYFKIDTFYKELALSYGIGLRLDLDFLVLRFDTGMKAINPMYSGKDKFPIGRPNFKRDFAFHFAVGYPF